jgi:hypothetical protein
MNLPDRGKLAIWSALYDATRMMNASAQKTRLNGSKCQKYKTLSGAQRLLKISSFSAEVVGPSDYVIFHDLEVLVKV